MSYHINNSSTNDLYTGSIAAAPFTENEPLSDINTNTNEYSVNLELNKNVYGICSARHELDEEFIEFAPKNENIKEFFDLFNTLFYELVGNAPELLKEFFRRSDKHVFPQLGFQHVTEKEIMALQTQARDTQRKIDNIEKNHPYYQNGTILTSNAYASHTIITTAIAANKLYVIQSAKKRLISNRSIFDKLKQDNIKQILNPAKTISDQEVTVYINNNALNAIPDGPPILTLNDLYIPISEVNSYNQINRPTPGDSLDRISRADDQRDTVGRGY